jgi:glycosyltransferase involved in cell wall biosynthesis
MKLKDYLFESDVTPLVSISCISFNQENYIEKTIEYFLNQEVNYPVEILIHDDASTDKTQEIIKRYQKKYPHIIKPILQTENQFSQGVKCIHATFNFFRSRGKYIATCEGDDYWIDSNKLNIQINFLENNKDFSLTSHEAYMTSIIHKKSLRNAISILYGNLYLSGFLHTLKAFLLLIKNNPEFWNKKRKPITVQRKEVADLEYLLSNYHKNIYIPTVSIVGRGDILRKLPKELLLTPSGHKEHIFWSAIHGKVKHFKEVMGQRNQQPNSLTITGIHLKDKSFERKIEHFTTFYDILSKFSNNEQKVQLQKAIKNLEETYG